jgi:hypothetical protein
MKNAVHDHQQGVRAMTRAGRREWIGLGVIYGLKRIAEAGPGWFAALSILSGIAIGLLISAREAFAQAFGTTAAISAFIAFCVAILAVALLRRTQAHA